MVATAFQSLRSIELALLAGPIEPEGTRTPSGLTRKSGEAGIKRKRWPVGCWKRSCGKYCAGNAGDTDVSHEMTVEIHGRAWADISADACSSISSATAFITDRISSLGVVAGGRQVLVSPIGGGATASGAGRGSRRSYGHVGITAPRGDCRKRNPVLSERVLGAGFGRSRRLSRAIPHLRATDSPGRASAARF
jgi:hypothetical protein